MPIVSTLAQALHHCHSHQSNDCHPIVIRSLQLVVLLFLASPFLSQNPPVNSQPATITATSNLVVVPTQVRSSSGSPILNLNTQDFHLTDNGVQQTILAESIDRQPMAIVVLMQTGGAAPRQFQNYRTFNLLLSALLSSTPDLKIARTSHKVALVTFDSQLREIWNFPSQVDGLKHAFANPEGGDPGAAILDALNGGLALLEQQPPAFRRVLLLLSQSQDSESQTSPKDLVLRLAASNTIVYSISFGGKQARTRSAPFTLEEAAASMRQDPAREAAALSGGEFVALQHTDDLVQTLSILATDFANSYTLSFHPSMPQPGLHTLSIQFARRSTHRRITARAIYWLGSPNRESPERPSVE